jgi:hypothetical protein
MYAALLFAQDNGAGLARMAGAGIGMILILWIIGLAAFVFWVWLIIDALVNEPTPADKILWFLVMFFLPIIGSIVYLIVRKGQQQRPLVG